MVKGKGKRLDRASSVSWIVCLLCRVILLSKNFSLKCITGVHPDTVNRWIRNVLRRGVSDLNLFTDFSDEDTEEDSCLPRELFLSSTLVKLKLRSEHCVDWWWRGGMMGYSFTLPMLKSLDIDSHLIFCGEIEEFIPSFPVLEELRMANMDWGETDVTVSSASLRKLSLPRHWL
ncbi:unnamed protein product [Thlaspi arvense]|uniref:F-box/LRR-repeat protein 15/At3g58940/PEG3-like LRR domain-containing protein n=1 Tax=Thlaspi arvense TaxID=13288 RepID=A0AAU9R5S6_THLAR|nr:unnamed protein product [Thlaspi arvense]